MKKHFFLLNGLFLSLSLLAQDVSMALQKQPIISPEAKAAQWSAMPANVQVSFGNSNRRYSRDVFPQEVIQDAQTLVAWKGEKVHTQLLIWSKIDVAKISVKVSNLKSESGDMISGKQIKTGFVEYVMTDEFASGCGYRKSKDFDSSLVADPINSLVSKVVLKKFTVQPVWVSTNVPVTAPAGEYTGTITIKADKTYQLQFTVKVLDKTLPPPSQWAFSLDLWQHPAAIARVHNVKLWSDKHFELMKKYYSMLAAAGQKNITASIVDEPWGHQTYDDFPSLIKWTKKTDGSWVYDYSLFDKYVSFVMDCGINQRINCYSMVPWKIAFRYYDEKLGKYTECTAKIGSKEYNEFWSVMLTDFTRHLKEKGWFSKTAIAMDERPMEAMRSVIKLLRTIDKDWKVALAGNYHKEIEKDIYDYCIASYQQYPDSVLKQRRQRGELSTWYTCCTEAYPNGFTFSPPAEHVWIGWYTAAKNMDGYLRWAYNSWPKDPVHDSRFTAWPAGDTYQVYPGPMSCIRLEKLIEGIQDFEKIRILRNLYTEQNDKSKLKILNSILSLFELNNLPKESAEETVTKAKQLLNSL